MLVHEITILATKKGYYTPCLGPDCGYCLSWGDTPINVDDISFDQVYPYYKCAEDFEKMKSWQEEIFKKNS